MEVARCLVDFFCVVPRGKSKVQEAHFLMNQTQPTQTKQARRGVRFNQESKHGAFQPEIKQIPTRYVPGTNSYYYCSKQHISIIQKLLTLLQLVVVVLLILQFRCEDKLLFLTSLSPKRDCSPKWVEKYLVGKRCA